MFEFTGRSCAQDMAVNVILQTLAMVRYKSAVAASQGRSTIGSHAPIIFVASRAKPLRASPT
jgi:hypothetical protein